MAYSNSTHNLAVTQETQKHFVILDDGSYYPVAQGADADFVRKVRNDILAKRQAGANTPANRRQRSVASRKSNKHTNYAAQVLQRNAATAELVVRVNEPTPDPTMDDNLITIHASGGTAYMNRETWKVSYA